MYLHAVAADVGKLQAGYFAYSHAGAVGQQQQAAVLYVLYGHQPVYYFFFADYFGQLLGLFGPGYFPENFFFAQHLLVIKFECVQPAVQGGFF